MEHEKRITAPARSSSAAAHSQKSSVLSKPAVQPFQNSQAETQYNDESFPVNNEHTTDPKPFSLHEDQKSRSVKPLQLKPNNTGLPDHLKAGVENLSGFSMDDVKVHYNSDKPAQLQALAFAEGTDIHIGTGQEKHLPHEAWHVVQQKQGRVQANIQLMGVAVNNDSSLEKEADHMGAMANGHTVQTVKDLDHSDIHTGKVKQCRMGMEFETGVHVRDGGGGELDYKVVVFRGQNAKWHVHSDGSKLEFVTDPTSDKSELLAAIADMKNFMDAVNQLLSSPGAQKKEIIFSEKETVLEGKKEKTQKRLVKFSGVKVQDIINHLGVVAVEASPNSFIGQEGNAVDFSAKPQVTFGIPLEQLLNFVQAAAFNVKLLKTPKKNRKGGDLSDAYKRQLDYPLLPSQNGHTGYDTLLFEVRNFDAKFSPGKIFDLQKELNEEGKKRNIPPRHINAVVGLYTAVFHHMNDLGAIGKKPFDYIKSAFTLLHRSDFHSMYKSLADEVKGMFNIATITRYAQNEKYLDLPLVDPELAEFTPVPTMRQWLSSIIDPGNLPEPHLQTKPKYSETGIYPPSLNNESADLKQKDLLSRGPAVSNSTSMGSLPPDKSDKELPISTLHLFEVRNLVGGGAKSQLPYSNWADLAASLFDFYKDWVLEPQAAIEKAIIDREEAETRSFAY